MNQQKLHNYMDFMINVYKNMEIQQYGKILQNYLIYYH
jgi:hypothetical protein